MHLINLIMMIDKHAENIYKGMYMYIIKHN